MRFRIFAVSFFAAYVFCANALSTCVYHCSENIDSLFFNFVIHGDPPTMKCYQFPQYYGRWLYTDLGVNATQTLLGDWRQYRLYTKDACSESCWTENGPIHLQDAVYFVNYEYPQEVGLFQSYRCIVITNPNAI